MSSPRHSLVRTVALAFLALSQAQPLVFAADDPPAFRYQDEAGSTHIAVLSVVRWEDAVEVLQPTFKLKEEEALQLAGASTQALEEKLLDSFRATLALAAPTLSESWKRTDTLEKGEVTTTGTRTVERAPGALPDVSTTLPTGAASGLPPGTSALASTPAIEPMLKYWTATALYQEVNLLNRYVKDAVGRKDHEAFVVRMQVSVMPSTRFAPYDAYSTMSFFLGKGAPQTTLVEKYKDAVKSNLRKWQQDTSLSALVDALPEEKARAARVRLDSLVQQALAVLEKTDEAFEPTMAAPYVVPLLVTDDLESATHSRALEQVRQYGAALSLMVQGFGAGANVGKLKDALDSALGRDFNSLLTVARVSDNTYRVRLGAMQQVAKRYAMVPRTHNVTLLLLVPKKDAASASDSSPREMQVISRTEFVDAQSGKPLAERSEKQIRCELDGIAKKYRSYGLTVLNPRNTDTHFRCLSELAALAQQNRGQDFLDSLTSTATNAKADCPSLLTDGQVRTSFPKEAFWLDLVSVMIGGQYSSTSFELPKSLTPTVFPRQVALLLDDGKDATTATLRGGKDLSPKLLSAVLCDKLNPNTQLVAERVEYSAATGNARLSFPSLKKWGLTCKEVKPCPEWQLLLSCKDCIAYGAQPGTPILGEFEYSALTQDAPAADPAKFSIVLFSEFLVADHNGQGTLSLEFRFTAPGTAGFDVFGADLDAITIVPADAQLKAGARLINKDCTVRLGLRNLMPNTKVKIAAWEERPVDGKTEKAQLKPDASIAVAQLQPPHPSRETP